MSIFYQTPIATGRSPAQVAHGAEIIAVRAVMPFNVAITANNKVEMLVLPADHVIVDAYLDGDRLDSNASPTLDYSVGLMSGTPGVAAISRTVGFELFGTSAGAGYNSVGRAAGGSFGRTTARMGSVFAGPVDRSIGIHFGSAAATFTADSTALTMKGLWQPATAYVAGEAITLPDGRRARCSTGGTSGTSFPFIGNEVKAGTVTDGTVTWTIVDAYIALNVMYRATRAGH